MCLPGPDNEPKLYVFLLTWVKSTSFYCICVHKECLPVVLSIDTFITLNVYVSDLPCLN